MSPEEYPTHNELDNEELCVHVTAPTATAFDNTYRAQRDAAVQFHPVNRIHIGTVSWPPKRVFLVDACDQSELAGWGMSDYEAVVTPVLKRKRDSGSQVAPPLKTRVVDNKVPWPAPTPLVGQGSHLSQPAITPDQPPPQPAVSPQTGLQTPIRSSWLPPKREIVDPQAGQRTPFRSPCLPQTYEEQLEYEYLSQVFESLSSSVIDAQLLQIQGSRGPPLTSRRIPITPGTPTPVQYASSRRPLPLPDNSSLPPAPEAQLQSSPIPSNDAHNQPPSTPVFPRLSSGVLLTFSTPAPALSSLELPPTFSPVPASQATAATNASAPSPPPFNALCPLPTLVDPPYRITAPSPETSSCPPQVPPLLCTLVHNSMPNKFSGHVLEMTRPLQRWERGYWRVDMTGWGDPVHKMYFWNTVKSNILEGRLGMVMLTVETEEVGETTERWVDERRRGGGEMERRGNLLRVYCYGATISYVWCALYVYGYRGMDGAVWVDASGEEVVRMK